jgi:hypothetical protein
MNTPTPNPLPLKGGKGLIKPPTPASPVLPPEGEDLKTRIFPLWGKWPEGPMGALFSFFRLNGEHG